MDNFFYVCNHTKALASHTCSSISAHLNAFFPSIFFPIKYLLRSLSISNPVVCSLVYVSLYSKVVFPFYSSKQRRMAQLFLNHKIWRHTYVLYNLFFYIHCHIFDSSLNCAIGKWDSFRFSSYFRTLNFFSCK